MALSIKNRVVEEKAKELARLRGKPITEVVNESLDRELSRQHHIGKYKVDNQRIARALEIATRSARRPDVNCMSDDDVLGYDDYGAPTR